MADPTVTTGPKPSHLSVDVLHRLMRLFMEHKTDLLLVVQSGRIIGQLDRLAIMEALSEIRPEGYYLAMKPADDADTLLKRMDAAGLSGLTTINQSFEFNALWSRAEILQAQGKIPQVKVWAPPHPPVASLPLKAAEREGEEKPIASQSVRLEESPAQRSTITIVRETPQAEAAAKTKPTAEFPRVGDRAASENIHRELERGRLAINTLAALDLPLMACDGSGREIFHNRAYADIRLKDNLGLKSDEMVRRAKDAITESALKGDLDIDKAVKLKTGPRNYDVFCKAIRDFENPNARAVGYIFWLTVASSGDPLSFRRGGGAEGGWGEAEGNYAGKTLPDILAAEEAKAMAWAMREANGNQSDAALLLGIPRQTFNYRYRRLTKPKK